MYSIKTRIGWRLRRVKSGYEGLRRVVGRLLSDFELSRDKIPTYRKKYGAFYSIRTRIIYG